MYKRWRHHFDGVPGTNSIAARLSCALAVLKACVLEGPFDEGASEQCVRPVAAGHCWTSAVAGMTTALATPQKRRAQMFTTKNLTGQLTSTKILTQWQNNEHRFHHAIAASYLASLELWNFASLLTWFALSHLKIQTQNQINWQWCSNRFVYIRNGTRFTLTIGFT